MAPNPPSRTGADVLKRFQRLEMDGDPLPPARPASPKARPTSARAATPAPRPPTVPREEPADLVEARRLAAELTANARDSLAQTGPAARRSERAAQLRARDLLPAPSAPRPADGWLPDPRPRDALPAGPMTRTFRFEVGQVPTMTVDPAPRDRAPMELPPDATPGVVVMEVDRGRARERRRDLDDHLGVHAPPAPLARSERAPPPIELTPFAARQVKLMAWEAGLPGSGLRILTSFTPGLGGPECDFAFDDAVQPDDVVFFEQGVRIIVDRTSLGHLRGRRITWHDVPGSEGFGIR